MWLAILFLGLVFFVVHGVYFSERLSRALALVFPRSQPWLRAIRITYRVVAFSVPVLLLGYVVYALIARPETIGPPDSRIYDYLVELPFWLVTIYSLQCSLLILPIDLIHIGLVRLGVAGGQRWRWRRNAAVLCIAAGFLVYVPVRMLIDSSELVVRVHHYTSPDLPPDLDGFEIALVADMQADQYTGAERLAQLVDASNQERPDLVLIAGDMITRAPRFIPVAAEQAARLRAPYGVLACIGDHDNFAYRDRARSLREVKDALARRGIEMVDNEVREIQVGGATIAVMFATNNYVSKIAPETMRGLLARAAGADLRVLLTHQPGAQLLEQARAGGTQLFLGGHTHGGQINFWLPFLDVTPVRLENRYITGTYRLGDMMLTVSSGLGMSVAPFRYRSPATLDIIRLGRE
ncbi:MAG TPA: metallophosphoesterase [Kofleriaceae bacterium]|nr:metallophosphoesterase [Kofleriaceae bacterium]